MADLTAQPLGPSESFNWVFLVDLLVCGVLALFFLFYFNRLFATLVSYAIRAWTWHKYRAYIDISALQISLLGGRLFFKSIRYHAHNETVLVHDGHVTWRYWLRTVQEAEVFQDLKEQKKRKARSDGEEESESIPSAQSKSRTRSQSAGHAEAGGKQKKEQPCRISIKVSGVEAFLYNRSPAYDSIVEATVNKAKQASKSAASEATYDGRPDSSRSGSKDEKAEHTRDDRPGRQDTNATDASHADYKAPEVPSWLHVLPAKIECKRAGVVLGNEHTTSVITAKLEHAVGKVDAGSASALDSFKLLFNFEFKKVNVTMKPNRDFKSLQLDAGQRALRERELGERSSPPAGFHPIKAIKRRWKTLTTLFKWRRSSRGSVRTASMKSDVRDRGDTATQDPIPGQAQWHGLMRYLEENETSSNDEWQDVEYAKSSTLVDCDQIDMRFYWDIPGKIPPQMSEKERLLEVVEDDDMNGSPPPDYGLDFALHGGFIVYGPWADRQRVTLQNVFIPASYVDAVPSQPLRPGDDRVCSLFKIFISIEKDVTLRIPTRESSKDDKWQGRSSWNKENDGSDGKEEKGKHGKKGRHNKRRKGKQNTSADARPYGWLDITVKADSTVNYVMDMFARKDGYRNNLDLDIKGTEITSSVNHGLLWRAGPLTLEADLSFTVGWNALKRWPFKIVCNDIELFILRDHMFLITDLINDWSSGPPPAFYTFVPYWYDLDITFRNWIMYLNSNDANIINDPAEFEKNEFLTLEGKDLHAVLGIPLDKFRPKHNEISFDVLSQGMSMRLLNSPRNTLNTLLPDKRVADLPKLTLNGFFCANSETGAGLVDVLRMDLVGYGLALKGYGFLVRHFINVKENYFGDYVHFKTLEEFQDSGDNIEEANEKTASLPKPQTANELDVVLCITAEDASVLLPTNLYMAKDYVKAEFAHMALDLRIASYYMDMTINFSPISILQGTSSQQPSSPETTASNTQLYIHHVDLNGHRAFGLPPNEPAYVSTWYVDVGAITGELQSSFIHDVALAANAFIFTFSDGENALPIESPNIFFEATFLQLRTGLLRVWLHVDNEALLVSADPVSVDFNDWADATFSQRVNVRVPNLTVACVDTKSATRHRTCEQRRRPVRTYAFLQTSMVLDVVGRKLQFDEELRKQQAYLRNNDQRTHRVPFLQRNIPRPRRDSFENVAEEDVAPPAMPYPSFPAPIDEEGHQRQRPTSIKSLSTVVSREQLKLKASSPSLSASIRNVHAGVSGGARGPSRTPLQRSTRSQSSVASSDYQGRRQGVLPRDRERSKLGLPPSTVAFSSSFAEPYFPLDLIEPDESNVPGFSTIADEEDKPTLLDTEPYEQPNTDPNSSQTTIMIRIIPGVRAYVEPKVAVLAANVLRTIQPRKPEDVMDAFQSSVMMSIVAQQQERHGQGESVEMKINLPSARLRVCAPRTDECAADVVNISLESLIFMMRQKKSPATKVRQQGMAFHATLDKLQAALQGDEAISKDPAIQLEVDDLTAWVALAATNKIHASIRNVSLGLASAHAGFMTGLAQRIAALVQDLQGSFDKPLEASQKRLQLLMYTLTQHGEHVGDPPFMSRMTYLLRAFHDHYRNQESWKVLMRFRHTLQCMPNDALTDSEEKMKSDNIPCPPDTPQRVLESWAQWRAWDVPNIGRTSAFKALFGESEQQPVQKSRPKPTSVTWDTRLLKIAIDEGEGSSQIMVGDVSLGLDATPPVEPTGLMLVDENKRTKTQLQIHSSSTGFQFHWNLVNVAEILVPEVLRIVARMDEEQPPPTYTEASDEGLNRHDFHVVVSTDIGSIRLETINLRHLSQAEGLRMSLIGTTQANDRYGECISAIISADSAITELHSQTSCIWQTLLTSPSVYIDHLQPTDEADVPPTVTLAMAYDELHVDVKEQVPGILQIADHVVTDEVAKVQNLVSLIQDNMPQGRPADEFKGEPPETSAIKLNAALLAGKLLVNISLLQALSYRLEGAAASVRVAPDLSKRHSFGIDFHVGEQNHSFINHSDAEDHQQGLLEVPPINGHVGLLLKASETHVSVATTVSRVEIDAGAIQGMTSVLSKSEVQGVMVAAKHGIDDIQLHVADVFPEKPGSKATVQPSSDKMLVYDVRLALLGVRVSATTPHMAANSTAHLELGIGPLHAKASNQASIVAGEPSLFPEVKAKIQDVGASLDIVEKKRRRQVGNSTLAILLEVSLQTDDKGDRFRKLKVRIPGVETNVFPETAAIVVDVINHMQDRIKDLDLSREKEYLRRLRANKKFSMLKRIGGKDKGDQDIQPSFSASDLSSLRVALEIVDIQVSWIVDPSYGSNPKQGVQDLVLTLAKVDFSTRDGSEARLTIVDLQLQLVAKDHSKSERTLNSALLPEMVFSVAYASKDKDRSLAFKASGKPLDVRLESRFIVPVNGVQRSIEYAVERFKTGTANWQSIPTSSGAPRAKLLGDSHFASLLVEADFAGAHLYMQGAGKASPSLPDSALPQQQGTQHGRYGQFSPGGGILHTSLKAPGIALKLEYKDTESRPSVNGEVRVDASSNMLLPNVVPLALEVSRSVKEVMQSQEDITPATPRPRSDSKPAQRFFEDESLVKADPTAIFGKTRVNLGLRVCKQEFALTCQPIAKVDAKAELEDFYFTVNTIDAEEHGHFFAMSAVLTKLNAQVKHMYSREPTFSFDMDSIVLSLMNSRHFSGVNGISAILKINPTRTSINARQLQDLLLFREIWLPPEIRDAQRAAAEHQSNQSDDFLVQRYQTVAAAAAFPWNATVSIAELAVDLDLGQSIGKSSFTISNLWASSQKTSNWEQNLCVGLDEMAVNSHGRMSGFIQLSKLGVRTSIHWPEETQSDRKTPLIQASVGFGRLRAKAAFDYQAFAFGDIEEFAFLMYNVRNPRAGDRDRLVAVLDCAKTYIFCTSTSPSQAFGLYQAFDRLVQEKQSAFQQSLKEVEKHLRRESKTVLTDLASQLPASVSNFMRGEQRTPISLHTDVVVTLGTISVGAFPGTFFDSQILKLEANNIQARFAVGLSSGKVHSGLGMTLGQLQVALASVKRVSVPKTLGDISVDEVISSAINAKGGIILRVPKVVASMRTWQTPETNHIEYIFKSLFEGKVDVGWNLSRINFIKGMYFAHTRALASRLGKPLPESAVKITAGPRTDAAGSEGAVKDITKPPSAQEQQKITAEVNLPQSKYEYHALEPPIIETPQLRDMGEATPPLEWIGLHRERLPNVTHQIIIVSLLEVAKEVEDAYSRILGTS